MPASWTASGATGCAHCHRKTRGFAIWHAAVRTVHDLPYRGHCETAERLTRWDDGRWLVLQTIREITGCGRIRQWFWASCGG